MPFLPYTIYRVPLFSWLVGDPASPFFLEKRDNRASIAHSISPGLVFVQATCETGAGFIRQPGQINRTDCAPVNLPCLTKRNDEDLVSAAFIEAISK